MEIKVLLVDDEEMALDFLNGLIDWESYGFKVVGTARSAEAAMTLYRQHHPELIISDVRMPGKTGLDFISEVRMLDNDVHILFLSGYESFSYAQAAIKLGSDDYILKSDLNEETLLARLLPLRQKIEREKEMSQYTLNSILEDVFHDAYGEEYYQKILNKEEFIKVHKKYCYVVFSIRRVPDFIKNVFKDYRDDAYLTEEELERETAAKGGRYGMRLVAYFHASKRDIVAVLDIEERISSESEIYKKLYAYANDVTDIINGDRICAYYYGRSSIRRFSEYYHRNQLTIVSGYLRPGRYISAFLPLSMDMERDDSQERFTEEQLAGDIEKGNFKRATACLEFIKETMKKDDMIAAMWCVKALFMALYRFEGKLFDDKTGIRYSLYDHSEEYRLYIGTELAAFLERKTQELQNISSQGRNGTFSENISKAIGYIQGNYMKSELSVSLIAQNVGFSESWLSTKFKEEVGVSLSDYINTIRVEQAKKLLKDTDDMVYEISERCGFTSSQYFSKIFKAVAGMTPNRYRKYLEGQEQ